MKVLHHKFYRKTPVLESLFFLKMIKLYRHLFSMNKLYFCWNVFLIDWCHKHLKNTMDLLLFYGEHFYGFLEGDLWKHWRKTPILQETYLYMQVTDILKFYEVLFCIYFKGLFLSLKSSHYVYICPYMHKTLETEKKQ